MNIGTHIRCVYKHPFENKHPMNIGTHAYSELQFVYTACAYVVISSCVMNNATMSCHRPYMDHRINKFR